MNLETIELASFHLKCFHILRNWNWILAG